jgi:hypothetical protein
MSLAWTIIVVILIIVVGFVLFAAYRNNLDSEDKPLASSLTIGSLALIAAVIAWYFTEQQITTAQRQANVALADMLDRRLTRVNEVRRELEKIDNRLLTDLTYLNPVPLRLIGPGPPDREKYQTVKSQVAALWQENDDLARTAMELRDGDAKEKVNAFLIAVNHIKTVATIMINRMDAMLEHCPPGGGAVNCDDHFFAERSQIDKLLTDTIVEKYKDVTAALSVESSKLSNHLSIIDQSLKE